MELFQVENLTYYYPEKEKPALSHVDMEIADGEFVFLSGSSGSGKSTLLKALAGLLPEYYGGRISGKIDFAGTPLREWSKRQLARNIGIIFQDPEEQLVMSTVEQEVAFGLENLGVPRPEMRRRVAEALAMMELGTVKHEHTSRLSGGMKQKTVLAAILAMQPQVLILDEPTSQLDPVAAQELLNYIHRLNQEWGMTIVMVEQRVDRCFHLADRVVIMEQGKVIKQERPQSMVQSANGYLSYLPPVCRVFSAAGVNASPLTVKDGREVVRHLREGSLREQDEQRQDKVNQKDTRKPEHGHGPEGKVTVSRKEDEKRDEKGFPSVLDRGNCGNSNKAGTAGNGPKSPLLEAKNLYYAYENRDFCLQNIDLRLYPGEITAVLGENGAGKSTLLKSLCGLLPPRRGKVFLQGEEITGRPVEEISRDVGLLTQNPNDYLFNDSVQEEIAYGLKIRGIADEKRVEKILQELHLEDFRQDNPRDLSGGERQRIALGTVMVTEPGLLLLDEPTRGMDTELKWELAELLEELARKGMAVMLVTHDVEFAARVAQKVLILSGGELVASGERNEVLANSLYFAPQVNKVFRGLVDEEVMTPEEAVEVLCALQGKQRGHSS